MRTYRKKTYGLSTDSLWKMDHPPYLEEHWTGRFVSLRVQAIGLQ